MGGKTGTTNDNTDGWFIGYTPQLLAGAWVGCDDPFLKIRWTWGGNEMAMPEWAYFMQKVYADKKLGIDPKAEFQKPAELDNNPIYADQNFSDIINKGEGSEFDEGNGDAGDYEGSEMLSPAESDFSKDQKDMNQDAHAEEEYKDIMKPAEEVPAVETKVPEDKNINTAVIPAKPNEEKNKKRNKKAEKTENDY
jgi:penicillin-binding protein 1A